MTKGGEIALYSNEHGIWFNPILPLLQRFYLDKVMLVLSLMLMAPVARAQAQDTSRTLKDASAMVPATRLEQMTPRSGIGVEYFGPRGQMQVPVSSLPFAIGVPQYATWTTAESETKTSLGILFEALAPMTPVDLSHIRNNMPRSLESLRDSKPLLQLQPK